MVGPMQCQKCVLFSQMLAEPGAKVFRHGRLDAWTPSQSTTPICYPAQPIKYRVGD